VITLALTEGGAMWLRGLAGVIIAIVVVKWVLRRR
jgi:hypothetical protein